MTRHIFLIVPSLDKMVLQVITNVLFTRQIFMIYPGKVYVLLNGGTKTTNILPDREHPNLMLFWIEDVNGMWRDLM